MTRHYSTKDFFRQMPNVLLARYFHARALFVDLDFLAMKETNPHELFNAWLALPDLQRNSMDAGFQEIFELSCEKGFRAIIDEAEWHLTHDADAHTAFVEKLAALSNHFERAMVTFLGHNQFYSHLDVGSVIAAGLQRGAPGSSLDRRRDRKAACPVYL